MQVYCENQECVYWTPSEESIGYCSKDEIHIQERKIETNLAKYEIPECASFRNKRNKDHLDFSRFPSGGRI